MRSDDDAKPADLPNPKSENGKRFDRFDASEGNPVRDRQLGRRVDLRCVPTAVADDLETEARFLGRLQHPGLPCVYDFVRDDTGAGLVGPPQNGRTLAAAIMARAADQSVPAIATPTACALTFIQLCDALSEAHQHGVAHQAISAECIILGDHGRVMLAGWESAIRSSQQPPLTSRLASSTLASKNLPPDSLLDDLRALAACFQLALAGTAPGRPTSAATMNLPIELQHIIEKALGSSAADGYPTVADMRADLLRYLSGQAPDCPPARVSRRVKAALALLLGAFALLLAFSLWHPISSLATWGTPLVDEDFSNTEWKQSWHMRGNWDQSDGKITSAGNSACALVLRRRLSPPVALEYTGRLPATALPGDLSVWWCEDNPFSLPDHADPDRLRGWYLQAGADNNSWCGIYKAPERTRFQLHNQVLRTDRDYRFRVEITTHSLTMWIDGTQVMQHNELFPIGSGHFALYTWDPGKVFDDVRIWQQKLPSLVSPLMLGDEAYRAGRYDEAIDNYQRVALSHNGQPLGDQAVYAMGLAMHLHGQRDQARKVWLALPEGDLRLRTDGLSIDREVADNNLDEARKTFTTLWRKHPDLHDLLAQRWQVNGQILLGRRPLRSDQIDAWIRLRDETFPENAASNWLVARMLNRLGRWEETIRRFPDDHHEVIKALLKLGRYREVLASTHAINEERALALAGLGQAEQALQTPNIPAELRGELLCKMGRPNEALPLHPLLAHRYLQDPAALLPPLLPAQININLFAFGRWEEAADAGLPGVKGTGDLAEANLLLGRLGAAERLGADVVYARLLEHLRNGRLDEARTLRSVHHLRPGNSWNGSWFLPIGLALADAVLGDDAALRKALTAEAAETGWGGRGAAVCSAALDPAKESLIAALPWRSETEIWMIVAAALRAELAGERPDALVHWQAFKALPPLKRLTRGHIPCQDLELTAAFRITMLSQQVP